jgi:hypothetical protein
VGVFDSFAVCIVVGISYVSLFLKYLMNVSKGLFYLQNQLKHSINGKKKHHTVSGIRASSGVNNAKVDSSASVDI